ncbi:MAG: hypothetical protein H7X97_04210 [Opitutaceae bacterium]|nr:hypothetical protein [Verrucomicrobiales bacterium]
MKTRCKRLKSSFERDISLELDHEIIVPSKERLDARLEAFKNRLLKRILDEAPTVAFRAPLRRAANEAAALVWLTPYPLLLLPVLMDEKARVACEQIARQKQINLRSQGTIEELV